MVARSFHKRDYQLQSNRPVFKKRRKKATTGTFTNSPYAVCGQIIVKKLTKRHRDSLNVTDM